MVIAYALFDLHLPECRGLKEKRMIVRSLKSRIRNDFEVSVAEVDGQDLLQRAQIGVGVVGIVRSRSRWSRIQRSKSVLERSRI